jgi:hypothetical protein
MMTLDDLIFDEIGAFFLCFCKCITVSASPIWKRYIDIWFILNINTVVETGCLNAYESDADFLAKSFPDQSSPRLNLSASSISPIVESSRLLATECIRFSTETTRI